MFQKGFTSQHRKIGSAAAWATCLLCVGYAVTTGLGFLSLKSPQDPIGDPYFTLMELLIIVIAPLMVITMIAVHAYAAPAAKVYSLTALCFMIIMAGITSGVHFIILTVGRPFEAINPDMSSWLFSFKWPSVVYALDILAWDWFFALSMLFAAPVFKTGKLEKTVRMLLILSGILSLAGLMGVPLGDMQVRNIGVIGYAGVAPVAFLLLGRMFHLAQIFYPS